MIELGHCEDLPSVKDEAADALVDAFVRDGYALMLIAFEANVPEDRREDIHLPVTFLTSTIQNVVIAMASQGHNLTLDDVISSVEIAVSDLANRLDAHHSKAH